ncbi:hypothetical protein FVE85_7024 [Porphyridium purpureum]|uniref:Uncharacterized protein n=1 Tax=Porphyridium purpureum TaxID=35688 RepID=A0A5J4Z5V9_PORPP|nr:hypothetical protein FVE85_7024 [Porphyridium purpureum]|eukprot:POR4800..scf295_1
MAARNAARSLSDVYRLALLPTLRARLDKAAPCVQEKFHEYVRYTKNDQMPITMLPKPPVLSRRPGPLDDRELQQLSDTGYVVKRKAFNPDRYMSAIRQLGERCDKHKVSIQEFADKDERFVLALSNFMCDEMLSRIQTQIYGSGWGWQKISLHRRASAPKTADIGRLNRKHPQHSSVTAGVASLCGTPEHVDTTETPNSPLTVTVFVPLTEQKLETVSRLQVYPGTHQRLDIPTVTFDYVSGPEPSADLISDINARVKRAETPAWVRDALFMCLVLPREQGPTEIYRSALLLMAYNPFLGDDAIKPVPISLSVGDVLLFYSNTMHSATPHLEPTSRLSVAMRAGVPYEEKSYMVSDWVSPQFFERLDKHALGGSLKRNSFLFAITEKDAVQTWRASGMNAHCYDFRQLVASLPA